MSNLTSIICSEYDLKNNVFVFISKNNDTLTAIDDYHLNFYFNMNKTLVTKPLSGIANYPSMNKSTFGGLCSFATNYSSIYMNFESSSIVNNSITTFIYQLKLFEDSSLIFEKTTIQLLNTQLWSLLYLNSSSLAYIATTHNSTMLAATNFNNSQIIIEEQIPEIGILARGGSVFQTLYLIQSHEINAYRLDTRQYATSRIHLNNLDYNNSIHRVPVGQVFVNMNSTIEYIAIYYETTGILDIITYDSLLSNYTTLLLNSIDYKIDVYNHNGTHSSNINRSHQVKQVNRTDIPVIENPLSVTEMHYRHDNQKRAIEPVDNIKLQSSDGAYTFHSYHYVGKNNEDFPKAAMLIATNSDKEQQNLPYNYNFFTYNKTTNQLVMVTESAGEMVTETHLVSEVDANDSQSGSSLNKGSIAGIVIGVIVFLLITIGFVIYARRRKNKQMDQTIESLEISQRNIKSHKLTDTKHDSIMTPFVVVNPKVTGQTQFNDGNHSHTSSLLQEVLSIPEEYYDDNENRPNIRPLSYNRDLIDFAQLAEEELLQLEPDIQGPLSLFSGKYISYADEKVTYLEEGYSIRTFYTNKGEKQTIHYFSNHRLDTFVRSVHAVLCITSNQQRKDKNLIQPYIIKSERAIVLNRPTPIFNYQYIWITSPMIPEYSLYHIMMKPSNSSFVDTHQIGYKVWSINALLKSIDTVHSHGFAHLAIDLTSFYINHEMKTTDWRLGNFDFARLLTDKYVYSRGGIKFPPHTSYTAPEIIQEKQITLDQLKKVDIWSLGCVIYTLVTEGLILFEDATHIKNLMTFNDDMKNYLKIVIRDHVENLLFKNLLELMLQVYPDNRKTIKEIISYWNTFK